MLDKRDQPRITITETKRRAKVLPEEDERRCLRWLTAIADAARREDYRVQQPRATAHSAGTIRKILELAAPLGLSEEQCMGIAVKAAGEWRYLPDDLVWCEARDNSDHSQHYAWARFNLGILLGEDRLEKFARFFGVLDEKREQADDLIVQKRSRLLELQSLGDTVIRTDPHPERTLEDRKRTIALLTSDIERLSR